MDAALVARAAAHMFDTPTRGLRFHVLPDRVGADERLGRRLEIETGAVTPVRVMVTRCPLPERRVLAMLDGARAVPRVYVDDTTTDQIMDVLMVDAGETPLGSDARAKRFAAEALSEVHAQFLGHDHQLNDVPPLTNPYLQDQIVLRIWRPAWLTALHNEQFVAAFGAWLEPVEQSAMHLARDLLAFADRLELNTLTHTNIHPGQMLEKDGRALIIHWGQARRAPLFVDLGDTFDTIEAGWVYRDALTDRGVFIDDDVFARGHRLALRFAGIRYLPFWLQPWLADPQDRNQAGLLRMLNMAAGITSRSADCTQSIIS